MSYLPSNAKPNVKLRSNVMPIGHQGLEEQVRGAAAIRKMILRRMKGSISQSDIWNLLRHADGLSPRQVIELAWDSACVECGAIPEGLRKGVVQFRCPKGVCASTPPAARQVNLTPDLLTTLPTEPKEFDRVVQEALERFATDYPRSVRLESRVQHARYARLKRYQELFYKGWTLPEFSDHVEQCLRKWISCDAESPIPLNGGAHKSE